MLTKAQKREQSDQLRENLSGAQAVFLLENHGLKVNDVNELRSQIRQTEGAYKVVKNSVVKLGKKPVVAKLFQRLQRRNVRVANVEIHFLNIGSVYLGIGLLGSKINPQP